MIDRYHEVGLRRNPFRAAPRDGIDDEMFVSRGLPDPPPPGSSALIQVIGDQGAGKSTHVHHWRRATPGSYHYIPRRPYRDRWVRGPVEPMVYGDEIDRMPVPLRRRWFRELADAAATTVIGTHVDLAGLGRRYGFEVTTHVLPPLDLDTLARVIDRRLEIEAAALRADSPTSPTGTGPVIRFADDVVAGIFARSGGSLREAEVLCHEHLADLVR